MLSPTLMTTTAFDATLEKTFEFSWQGNQAQGSRLIIRNNETNAIVSQTNVTSMKLQHPLSANVLKNGICYNATLYVLDASGTVMSAISNTIVFYCYSTPTFGFSNVADGQIISNSYFEVSLTYAQTQGEPIQSYKIDLCNNSHAIVMTSGTKYDDKLSSYISGLTDNNTYYLRATGVTLNGMQLDTGYIAITIEYINPILYSIVGLENDERLGQVLVSSYMVSVEGYGSDGISYIDNTKIDTRDGEYIGYNEVHFPSDFKLGIIFSQVPVNQSLLWFTNGVYEANLYYREGSYESNDGTLKGFFELRVNTSLGESVYCSDYIDPIQNVDGEYHVWIRKVGNVYSVNFVESEVG